MKRYACHIIAVLLLSSVGVLSAQENCSELLTQAQADYQSGSLKGIPTLLEGCMEEGFSKEERINAQRLITNAYVFLDSVSYSENEMEEFIRLDPEYLLSTADPLEFVYLHHKFRTNPILRVRIFLGANYSLLNTLRSFGVENLLDSKEQPVSEILFNGSVGIERVLVWGLEVSFSALVALRSFSLTNDLYQYSNYEITETQFAIETPLEMRYYFNHRRSFQPYLLVGWSPSLLLSASLTATRQGGTSVNLSNQDLLAEELRPLLQHYAIGGLGFRYRLGSRKAFISLELSYARGLTDLSISDNKYQTNQDLIFRAGYVDNSFGLDAVTATLGYTLSIYSPKKLRRYR